MIISLAFAGIGGAGGLSSLLPAFTYLCCVLFLLDKASAETYREREW